MKNGRHGATGWMRFALLAALLLQCGRAGDETLTASGIVEGTEARLGFQVAGRLGFLAVREGDSVEQGRELARLDLALADARVASARARAEAARALLRELEAGSRTEEIAAARAAHVAADQRLSEARRDLERMQHLLRTGAISREAFDKAQLAADLAESQLVRAAEELKLLERGPRSERLQSQRAQVAEAEAAVQAGLALRADGVITAPFAGVITIRHGEPGETFAPGAPVLTLLNREDRWLRVFVPEYRIGAIRLGQAASIRCDTYPDKRYDGRVTFIASTAEFTPRSVQTREERVRLVYAVKVTIVGDPDFELKPGLPADVTFSLSP